MTIAVIGGSGLIGAKLVNNLRHRGHDVRAASLRTGVNAITGEGLAAAIAGALVVVDVTDSSSLEGADVLEFFQTSCRNILAAESAAHVRHHIVLSVVGTDRLLESSYFRAKLAQEDLIKTSPIPHTILRSTQFFEFIYRIARLHADEHAVRVPPSFVQPVASDEVAAALADIAAADPLNDMVEHAGPELLRLDEAIRRSMQANRDPREVITDSHARYFGAALSDDTLTPDEDAIIGVTRFDDWLKQYDNSTGG